MDFAFCADSQALNQFNTKFRYSEGVILVISLNFLLKYAVSLYPISYATARIFLAGSRRSCFAFSMRIFVIYFERLMRIVVLNSLEK